MITPAIRGGHEVCTPVAVEGAEAGDGIAIRIKDIAVTSRATSSGNDQAMEGRFNGDPYCAAGVPRLRHGVARDAARGIGETAVVRRLRCRRHARSRSRTATRSCSTAGSGCTVDERRAKEFAEHAAESPHSRTTASSTRC